MAVALQDRKRVTDTLKSWLDDVAQYERVFKPWEARANKIVKKYRDEYRDAEDDRGVTRFNILWSNTQTLSAATFARLPKPDVSRRFRDTDPIGRIASLILERALDYEIQQYPDYAASMRASVQDRFLGGRATTWMRYEPRFKAKERGEPESGVQVTDDVEDNEVLEYECAPCDYVYYRDFGHTVARTWEEVPRVWRKVYMTKEALEKRFDEATVALIPMDASPIKEYNEAKMNVDRDRACIFEGWDRNAKKAVWFSKGVKDFLDERDDPLALEEFFPCPKPLFATLTNDTLIPVPDYTLYQDQANELDILSDRIDALVKALKVRGVYDDSFPALKRLFSEGSNTDLIPIKNFNAFAEKNGLKGAIDIVDLEPISKALVQCYAAMEQVKAQVYEITGISDIVRGNSEPSTTATAEQIKGQYASLRLKQYQEQVAKYATEILQIKAQIICNKFDPQTILKISAADQLTVTDSDVLAAAPQLGQAPPPVPPQPGMPPQPPPQAPIAMIPQEMKKQIVFEAALKLLIGERMDNPEADAPSTLRSFRVEVAADSLIYLDEQQEKESRMAFLTAQGAFMKEFVGMILQAGPAAPALVPLVTEMWKFGVTAFRVGKSIEGAFDEAMEKMKKLVSQPQGPDPEKMREMAQQMEQSITQKVTAKAAQDNAQKQIAFNARVADKELALAQREAGLDVREMKFNAEQQIADEREKARAECEQLGSQLVKKDLEGAAKAAKDEQGKLAERERISSQAEAKNAKRDENMERLVGAVIESSKELQREVATLVKVASAKKRVVRDGGGRATHLEPVF